MRPNNEDAYVVCRLGRFMEVLSTNLPERELALVVERAARASPEDLQRLFAMALEHIDDVGMISKMSLASGGRKAFERVRSEYERERGRPLRVLRRATIEKEGGHKESA